MRQPLTYSYEHERKGYEWLSDDMIILGGYVLHCFGDSYLAVAFLNAGLVRILAFKIGNLES